MSIVDFFPKYLFNLFRIEQKITLQPKIKHLNLWLTYVVLIKKKTKKNNLPTYMGNNSFLMCH